MKDRIIEDLLQESQVKSNEKTLIRNGGVFRIILDSILTLLEGCVSCRIKNCQLEKAVCESSDSSIFAYSSKNQLERHSYQSRPSQTQSNVNSSTIENDFDIQTLIRILNAFVFKIDVEIDKVEKIVLNNAKCGGVKFYLTEVSDVKLKYEINKMQNYLDNSSWQNTKFPGCSSD